MNTQHEKVIRTGSGATPGVEWQHPDLIDVSDGSDGPFISIKSLWKVFGKGRNLAELPAHAEKSKDQVLAELGSVLALQDVSFTVDRGETFVVMGLSGSGKSTLIRCLVRLIEPTSGEIKIDGQDILDYDEKELIRLRREKIAMVFQHYGLLPHRRVIDNAAWGLEVQGVAKSTRYARTREVLELVGLKGWEEAYPRELSGGMQQRVGLARALAVNPAILLMDEPFSGLDPLIRRNMQEELIRLQQELHKTIIFITHDLNEALKIGDRIAIMRDGRIIQIGTPEEIVLTPEDDYVGAFTQDVRRESIMTAASVMAEPAAVILNYQGPGAALHLMRSRGSPIALIVDVEHNYLGTLSLERAQDAAQANVQHIEEHPEYFEANASLVTADTPCEQLIPLCMSCDHSIPVVDKEGKLVGEVHRAAVAAALSTGTLGHRNS